jgi:hypothetical protein
MPPVAVVMADGRKHVDELVQAALCIVQSDYLRPVPVVAADRAGELPGLTVAGVASWDARRRRLGPHGSMIYGYWPRLIAIVIYPL